MNHTNGIRPCIVLLAVQRHENGHSWRRARDKLEGSVQSILCSDINSEVGLLGADGEVVGSTVASTNDFAGTWSFKAPVLVERAVRFQMKKLTRTKSPHSSDWEKRRSCAIPSGLDRPPYTGDLPRSPGTSGGL